MDALSIRRGRRPENQPTSGVEELRAEIDAGYLINGTNQYLEGASELRPPSCQSFGGLKMVGSPGERMDSMLRTRHIVPALLIALVAIAGLSPASADEESKGHLEVDPDIPCDVCHAEMTPKVFKMWYAGEHGKQGVKCFVCHGSIGSDFTLKPENFRCVGCHADEVETSGEVSCFSCHPPHPLTPHLMKMKNTEGGDK